MMLQVDIEEHATLIHCYVENECITYRRRGWLGGIVGGILNVVQKLWIECA